MTIKNIENINSEDFGGKALGLKKLIQLGVKVPMAFAIDNSCIKKIISNDNKAINELQQYLKQFAAETLFAVRSSASNEDGVKNSFAGMYESILNVDGNFEHIIQAIKEVYSSAKSKKIETYSKKKTQMNIVIQQMVQPKIAGVCFTKAIDLDGENIALIEYVDGLADKLVGGKTSAKTIKLNLTTFKNKGEIEIEKEIVSDLFYSLKQIIKNSKEDLDIEWCVDNDNNAYFVQARPITENILLRPELSAGAVASPGTCFGEVYIIDDNCEDDEIKTRIENFPQGAILIARTTDTNYVPAMKKAAGIITTEGSILSHAAIIAREFNIPCVTGFKKAFEIFENNNKLSLDTNTLKMNYNKEEILFGKDKEVNLLEIYDYDNIVEEKYDDNIILVENVDEEFGIHISEDLDQKEIDKIDIYIRKKYKKAPIILQDQKYLWYFEFQRFIKIPGYFELVKRAENICHEMNNNKVDEFITDILKIMDTTYNHIDSAYDKVYAGELAQALHYLINLHFCNGLVMKKFLNISKEKNINLKDIICSPFSEKEHIFLNKIEKIRESIWSVFLKNGWTDDEYFDTRVENMKTALNYIEDDVIDYFYQTLQYKNSLFGIADDKKKL